MIEGQTAPLEIARRVLTEATIARVIASPFPNSAYLILDRWALNQPNDLKQVALMGSLHLLSMLEEQATIEHRVLTSEASFEAERRGMGPWEILELHEIDTSLHISG